MQYINKLITILTFVLFSALNVHAQVTATITPIQNGQGGSITLDIQGGNAPFTFQWFKIDPVFGQGAYSTEQNIKDLEEGEYCVEITDDKCCTAQQCFEIKKEECNSVFVANKVNPSFCSRKSVINTVPPTPAGKDNPGPSDGSVTIGITPPYTAKDFDFTWEIQNPNGVFSFFRKGKDLVNLVSGTYKLKVKNIINGCEQTLFVTLCCCSGYEVSYFDEAGNFLYTRFESNPQNLNQCFKSDENPLKAESNPKPPSSNTSKDGSISLVASGGTGPSYYYKWSGPNGFTSTSASISGLSQGEYCYTVTDGCGAVKDCIPMYVCEEKPMKITATLVRPCKSSNPVFSTNSVIEIVVTGGFLPYKYQWSNGSKTPTLKNPPIGQYTVTVTDKGGCTKVESYNLGAGQITKIATNQPCAITYFCDLVPAHFVPYQVEPKFDDPNDCRIQNFYCLATGNRVASVRVPFTSVNSSSDCRLTGTCPGTGQVVTIENGILEDYYGPYQSCASCIGCIHEVYCTYPISNTQVLVSRKQSSVGGLINSNGASCLKDYCGFDVECFGSWYFVCLPCSGGKPAYKASELALTEIILGDEFLRARRRGEMPSSRQFMVPMSAKLDMNLQEYFTLMESETEKRIVGLDEEFKEYSCPYKCVASSDNTFKDRSGLSKSDENNTSTITPNPFSDFINLNYKSDAQGTINIEISNIIGIKILEKVYTVEKGGNVINIDTKAFADGAYILKVLDTQSNQISSYTLIKQ